VVKFHRGLDPCIQDAIATMTSGHPSDKILMHWYYAAQTLDQNQATNEAFQSSYHVPNFTSTPSQTCQPIPSISHFLINAYSCPSPGNSILMDVDAAWRKATPIISCYHCRKAGHKSMECDLCFDIHSFTVDKFQSFLVDKLAALDVVAEEDDVTVEENKPEVQDLLLATSEQPILVANPQLF
jgi:hypothetical protein